MKNKTHLLTTMVMTALAALTLISCGDGATPDEPYVFPEPQNSKNACVLAAKESNEILTKATFTESGKYVLIRMSKLDGKIISTGTYKCNDETYLLSDYGTITIMESKASKDVTVHIKIEGDDEYEFPCTMTTPTMEDDLFRTWTVEKTRLTLNSEPPVTADFDGFDAAQIAKFLNNNGIHTDESATYKKVKTVTFSATGAILIEYEDGTTDAGEINTIITTPGKQTTLGFAWYDDNKPFVVESSIGHSEFDKDRCIFTMTVNFKDNPKFQGSTVAIILKP